MNGSIQPHNDTQQPPKRVFIAATIAIFFLALSAADSIGFVPEYLDTGAPREVALSDLPELGPVVQPTPVPTSPTSSTVVKPDRIIIPEISLNLNVLNPDSRDLAVLDSVLQNGPARYVDSARLGEDGNVLIFAHTSHLPVVRNSMYKAFNRLPELKTGDLITVKGGDVSYTYSVTDVRRANAEDAVIDLSTHFGKRLTLVTCDTLTSKSSRWIVEAELVE